MMVSFLNPGVLRTEMALEKPEAIPDGMGGFSEHWTEIATIFARIEPLAAESRFGADKQMEAVTHRITLRKRQTIESNMRFRRGSRVFQIVTLHDPDESGRYLVCRTREGEP
ncbi:phage head closure protein [Aquamicrobium segne]|uniref:Phage head closure protein n=1 Tax=Aquamicrobium segne TaxID=469547 RepID=A0ABW0GVF3_9HYPH